MTDQRSASMQANHGVHGIAEPPRPKIRHNDPTSPLSDDLNLVFLFLALILACHYFFCLCLVTEKFYAKPSR
jgi:hypothetical protein